MKVSGCDPFEPMDPTRVLLSIADFPPYMDGGVAEAARRTFDALRAAGASVNILVGRPAAVDPPPERGVIPLRIPLFGRPELRYFSFELRARRSKRRLIRDADVFHNLGTYLGDMGRTKLAGRPYVVTVHNTAAQVRRELKGFASVFTPGRRAFYGAMARIEQRVCRLADAVVVPSHGTREDVERSYGIPPERIVVIPQGVDPRKVAPPPPEDSEAVVPYLLFVGRLVPRKGVEDLVDAFALLAARRKTLHLVIIGRGDVSYENALAWQVQQRGLRGRVRIFPRVSDEALAKLYHQAELFVFPSRVEGFGLAPAEASACGTPVVAFDIPGLRDVVVDGVTGKLVPERNPSTLAETIDALLSDTSTMARLRSGAREHARHFTWERTARELLQLYGRLLGGHQATRLA